MWRGGWTAQERARYPRSKPPVAHFGTTSLGSIWHKTPLTRCTDLSHYSLMLQYLGGPKRAAYLRAVVLDYLTDLNQHLPRAQTYEPRYSNSIPDARLCGLVEFGLKHANSPLKHCTDLQRKLMVVDATGRRSADMHRPCAGGETVDGRQSRRVTTEQIRKRFGLSDRQMRAEMQAGRAAVERSLLGEEVADRYGIGVNQSQEATA